uniref:Protein kinase domain-containing protein n=1 Tax=Brassica campestris TaxID=3711 RepID=M4F4T4_BRACM|nr:unnamed protein product [Brassica rapa]
MELKENNTSLLCSPIYVFATYTPYPLPPKSESSGPLVKWTQQEWHDPNVLIEKSSILHSQPKSTVGTPAYIAPGILLRREYDGKFQEPEQPMQSLDNIMQIISEATIPDVRSLYGFLLNLRLMLIVAEK